ncbi:MAG: AMP-binding protein [Spirochaetaceae bacterium]|jgi:long-chain acyl-CoA synthetase|nr:AMP-binding protein [Spirochaetaceae bacterium]
MIQFERLTLPALALAAAAQYKNRHAFGVFGNGRINNSVSYAEFGGNIRRFARRLREMNIAPGDRVMILSENRPEWAAAYFGIALAGAVSVPVLPDFSAGQIENIAAHAEISAVCLSGKTARKFREWGTVPVINFDRFEQFLEPEHPRKSAAASLPDDRFPAVEEDSLASILYTSGTTGQSKGVMLSHRNLVYTAAATRSIVKIYPRDRFLSLLPLAHAFECTMGMLIAVMSGASITYLNGPPVLEALLEAAQAVRPTAMLTVPLIIEKLYRGRIEPALKASPLYRFPLTRPMAAAIAGRKLMGWFGGCIRFFSIGGAALAEDVEYFLRKIQFPYTLGYGMTEAAPLLAGTAPFKFPPASAGRVLTGVSLRIVNGEIQAKGPNLTSGYYRDADRTQASFTDDGWFKTGDLGEFDRKGYLYIKGRLKAMILGPSGENIYPEEIESLLNKSEIVEDALVCTGEKGELAAIIVLSEAAKALSALDAGAAALGGALGLAGGALGSALQELKRGVNKRLASFSRISRIEVRTEPFEKTATQKIKRFLYHNTK